MTVTSTGATGSRAAFVEAVRARAGGDLTAPVEVVRQAVRGADELLLLRSNDNSWWVTRRVDGVARVCAYIGDVEAERDFELFLGSPSPRGTWNELEVPAVAA